MKEHLKSLVEISKKAEAYHRQGNLQESRRMFEKALKMIQTEEALAKDTFMKCRIFYGLGRVVFEQGYLKEALKNFNSALQIQLDTWGEGHEATAETITRMAYIYVQQQNWKQGEVFARKALNIYQVLQSDDLHTIAQLNGVLATAVEKQGKFAESIKLYKKALAGKLKTFGDDHVEIAHEYNSIGTLLCKQGRYEEADTMYTKALDIENRSGESHPRLVACILHNQATALTLRGEFNEAMDLFQQVLAINLEVGNEMHPETGKAYHEIAKTHFALGSLDEALATNMKAVKVFRRKLGDDHPWTERAMTLHREWLGQVLSKRK